MRSTPPTPPPPPRVHLWLRIDLILLSKSASSIVTMHDTDWYYNLLGKFWLDQQMRDCKLLQINRIVQYIIYNLTILIAFINFC